MLRQNGNSKDVYELRAGRETRRIEHNVVGCGGSPSRRLRLGS